MIYLFDLDDTAKNLHNASIKQIVVKNEVFSRKYGNIDIFSKKLDIKYDFQF